MKFKVLVADSIDQKAIDFLKNQPHLEVKVDTKLTPEELIEKIPSFHGIIIRSATQVTRPVIEAGTDLKIIARAGVGLDNVDQTAAKERGIEVRNTPTCTTISVAEIAFGMMLSLARKLGPANISMKEGKWDKKSFGGIELYEKTLGLIGAGRIGMGVAERAKAFGMNVIAFDKFIKESPLPFVKMVSMEVLLAGSDFISLHIPYVKEDGPTLAETEFKLMKKGTYIINAARGGTISEKDLLQALINGTVAGIGIDVWEKEPTDNMELVRHPNVLALPHLGASAEEGQSRAGQEVAEIVAAALK